MAIIVDTSEPERLLDLIREAIDDGTIQTWSYDRDGDFTHTSEQWAKQAWLSPNVLRTRLVFNIVPPRNTHVSRTVYAVYHGRFLQVLLAHFDENFTDARITAMPTARDDVGR